MINTPYDDVFRTLLNDCPKLIIPVINEIFKEHYSGAEDIQFLRNCVRINILMNTRNAQLLICPIRFWKIWLESIRM